MAHRSLKRLRGLVSKDASSTSGASRVVDHPGSSAASLPSIKRCGTRCARGTRSELHSSETLPSGARPRLAARWLHPGSCWGARSSVSAWNCWHAGRDSNPRPPGSKPDRSVRSNAYLRLLPCRGLQAAAQSGTGDGPTALGGPSFQGPSRRSRDAAALFCWMNSAKERTSSRDFTTRESVWSGGGLQASGPGSAPIFRGPDLPRGGTPGRHRPDWRGRRTVDPMTRARAHARACVPFR